MAMIKVWDPFVRIFHWSLVIAVLSAWATSEDAETVHAILGYCAGGLVAARILWGLMGTRYARFSSFVAGPAGVIGYLAEIKAGREARYIGHNPAGGAMILALLGLIGAIAITGWMMSTDRWWGVSWVQHLHNVMAHGLIGLVAVHVAGVLLASLRHDENLIKAMITGEKRP